MKPELARYLIVAIQQGHLIDDLRLTIDTFGLREVVNRQQVDAGIAQDYTRCQTKGLSNGMRLRAFVALAVLNSAVAGKQAVRNLSFFGRWR